MLPRALSDFIRTTGLSDAHARELERLLSHRSPASKLPSSPLDDGSLAVASNLTLQLDSDYEDVPTVTSVAGVDRYEDLGPLGEGAMGEVRRVRDRDLNRTMAMKVIRVDLMQHPAVLARFVEEAQCSAQLQHPGIVPVHELGRTPDGRVYFTMREVRGRTLGDVIAEVHTAPGDAWGAGLRRLVEAFRKVCEAVGYAHSRGVVHRDLKPANVMVGEFGEVLVVDWGLAKVQGARDRAAEAGDLSVIVTDRAALGGLATRMGAVAGTPAYMPPEQARGEIDRIDARSDVYALGAMLYEILAGRPPYEGPSGQAVVRRVLDGPPEPVDRADTLNDLPPELVAACSRAMARQPEDRHGDAIALATEVTSWLEGSRRREQALAVVAQAAALGPEAVALRERAAGLRADAVTLLASLQPYDPEQKKAEGWAKEDEAIALEHQVEALDLEAGQRLIGALQVDPATPEAHAALAGRHAHAHREAEAAHDDRAVAREEALLRTHATHAPPEAAQRWAAYLKGDGALTLVTDPPGADVILHRYVLKNRRLIAVFERSLGVTPLRAVPLAMGSYLCVLRHPDRPEVRYPVSIGRGEHWDGVPPEARDPHPIHLPPAGGLDADDHYVPPGWFWSGGDAEATDGTPRRRLWAAGMVMKRFPLTNGEYLVFLDDLVAHGREQEALRWAPREKGGTLGEDGALILGRDAAGKFQLRADAEGDVWEDRNPVTMVHLGCAVAYGRWAAERTGRPWRLPGELEWEKAARGVDGRYFPWGDVLDPSWCCMRDSHIERPAWVAVERFPVDESVYGVRGLGGNAEDWCAELYRREGPESPGDIVVAPAILGDLDLSPAARRGRRGGIWSGNARSARCCNRNGTEPSARNANLGIRLVRSYVEEEGPKGQG